MTIDHERVAHKIAYIREQITAIEDLIKSKSKDDLLNDSWIINGLKYTL